MKSTSQQLRAFRGLPETVRVPNGLDIHFHPSIAGGMWNGRRDENMPGKFGYTYGHAHLTLPNGEEKFIPGYVCHYNGLFRTQDVEGQKLIGQEPEPNRVGLTSKGFTGDDPATV